MKRNASLALKAQIFALEERQAGDGMISHPLRVFRDNLEAMEAALPDARWVTDALARALQARAFGGEARRARLQRHAVAAEAELARRRAHNCLCHHYYRTRSLAPWFIEREIRRHMAAEAKRG